MEQSSAMGDTLRAGSTEYETQETVVQGVKGDTLSLTIPMVAIQSLPDGAAFTKKTGRTRLSLTRKGDAVVAEAETDSIGREVSRYERRARDSLQHRTTNAINKTTQKEKPPNGSRRAWVLIGIVITIGIIIVLKRLFK